MPTLPSPPLLPCMNSPPRILREGAGGSNSESTRAKVALSSYLEGRLKTTPLPPPIKNKNIDGFLFFFGREDIFLTKKIVQCMEYFIVIATPMGITRPEK